jgi:hypothetical protein
MKSTMDSSDSWRSLFESWPESIPRQGMIVTSFQETIQFANFLVSSGILLLERDKPDTYGARKVFVAYDAISAVKLPTPMELARFQVMGFQPPMG